MISRKRSLLSFQLYTNISDARRPAFYLYDGPQYFWDSWLLSIKWPHLLHQNASLFIVTLFFVLPEGKPPEPWQQNGIDVLYFVHNTTATWTTQERVDNVLTCDQYVSIFTCWLSNISHSCEKKCTSEKQGLYFECWRRWGCLTGGTQQVPQ